MEAAELLQQSIRRAHFARNTPRAVSTEPPKPVERVAIEETHANNDRLLIVEQKLDRIEQKLDRVMHMLKALDATDVPSGDDACRYLTGTEVRKLVCEYFDIKGNDIDRKCQAIRAVRPRHIAFYLCRKYTVRSYPEIGRLFGGRDHTTVLHGERKIAHQLAIDPKLNDDVTKLEARIDSILARRKA